MDFKIESPYKPTGDQPTAIREIAQAIKEGQDAVTLLGVTGSGKTFTLANVIEKLQRPALILSHNKTLAAQLYGEFKSFFPNNAVEYFVSYYDYYQPEAYMPVTDTYIEKDLSINDEIEKLRLSCSSALLSGRRDVIVVSSVSCLYGIGNPADFHSNTVTIKVGQVFSRTQFLYKLVDSLYSRNDVEFKRGTFRVKGDSVDIYLAYGDKGCRVIFFGDEIEEIEMFDPVTGGTIEFVDEIRAKVTNGETASELWSEIEREAKNITEKYELLEINKRPAVANTRLLYRALGKDPNRYRVASEALCRRVISGLGLYRIDTLVDLINLVSMKSGYPISGLDADKLVGNTLSMGVGEEGEVYNGIGRGLLNISGMPVYRDEIGGVATPTSDEERTKITLDTCTLQMNINGFGTEMPMEEAVAWSVELLKKYAFATDIETDII